ncbi:MAG: glycosyltransferase family 9 protein [Candidatus Aminicenantes bacterium]|nr:MAG: glycosyltransferase family 9 protein [Candidatus Aminicenantes bacterium]
MRKILKAFKNLYLSIRAFKFIILSNLTSRLRKKEFDRESTRSILVISLKRVGDVILSIPAFRAIKESLPKSQVTAFADAYTTDILERIPYIDAVVPYGKDSSFLKKAKQVRKLSYNSFDLALDLTCDYTFEGALWTWLSGAKFRVGYDTWKRGFLFHRPVTPPKGAIHAIEEILNVAQNIGLTTKDKYLKIGASKEATDTVKKFLQDNAVKSGTLLIGIHPGGYYPTQRWLTERFAEVADKLIEKHKARIVLIGGPKDEKIIQQITTQMDNPPLIFVNKPLGDLLALLQSCHLLICNNSGPLHMATALGTLTVSTMGPTLPERWWPQGEKDIVIHKDLPCMPCNEGYCRPKTLECMKLITVEDMLEAAETQISKIKKTKK